MSLLVDLVRRQTVTSTFAVVSRTIDKTAEALAEALAEELLHDPVIREELRDLVRAAFTEALQQLRQPAPPAEKE